MASRTVEIAIVGAGVVGLATALRLAGEGREVLLIDPNEPGSGASYGNAGTLAEYACVPVGTPAVLRSLPKLLLDRDSPFALQWSALYQFAPWLAKFVRQSLPAAARGNAVALAGLLADALPAWEEMVVEADAADLLQRNGCLYVCRRESDMAEQAWSRALRSELGAHQQLLTPQEVAVLEPNLPAVEGGGLYFPDAISLTDPGAMTRKLLKAALARGASVLKASVTDLKTVSGGVELSGPGCSVVAGKAVIAAGAFSRPLAAQAGDDIPLETERGYHLEFATDVPLLRRPVCPLDLGFYMTPMAGRIRAAGTVELGKLGAPVNPRRLELLDRGIRQFFPTLGEPSSRWLGFRPSLPDSRPVIGPASGDPNVIYAFGHGHIGLTLSAVTARTVAAFIHGRRNDTIAEAFSARRFKA